jgi:predicted DNA-binding transcriptional regulator AlpA
MGNFPKAETTALNARDGIPRRSYTIREFCGAHGISQGLYEKLRKEGAAPREFRLGRRVLISVAAAEEWIASREAAAAKSRKSS